MFPGDLKGCLVINSMQEELSVLKRGEIVDESQHMALNGQKKDFSKGTSAKDAFEYTFRVRLVTIYIFVNPTSVFPLMKMDTDFLFHGDAVS